MKFPLCCYTANSTHKMNENKSTIQKLLSGSTKKVLTLLTKVREKYQLFLQDTFSPSLLTALVQVLSMSHHRAFPLIPRCQVCLLKPIFNC